MTKLNDASENKLASEDEGYVLTDSNHAISAKYSVIGTLHHRANTISSSPELLQKEQHLKKVLTRCKYPDWAINRVKIKMRTPAQSSKQKKELHEWQPKTKLHSGAILQRAGRKPQKNLPKIWSTSVLQRR